MKEIFIIEQLTGSHGAGATKAYQILFSSAYPEAKISVHTLCLEWDKFELNDSIKCLIIKINEMNKDCIIVCLGADWHSKIIHANPILRHHLQTSKALKINIFQESYLEKKKTLSLISSMHSSYDMCSGIYDIEVYNHYRDYLTAKYDITRMKKSMG